ncbi:MAG: sulfur-carrier protein, partial [Actinomycetota bacterium]|nr:sulfur-carrier protein [Actinomycetota bacterium]
AAHGTELGRVLGHCTFLVDGVRANPQTTLTDGVVIEVLPPFAGG